MSTVTVSTLSEIVIITPVLGVSGYPLYARLSRSRMRNGKSEWQAPYIHSNTGNSYRHWSMPGRQSACRKPTWRCASIALHRLLLKWSYVRGDLMLSSFWFGYVQFRVTQSP